MSKYLGLILALLMTTEKIYGETEEINGEEQPSNETIIDPGFENYFFLIYNLIIKLMLL